MCSIGGWYAWGKARPSVEIVQGLLRAGATHGGTALSGSNDATGVAYLANGPNPVIMIAKDSLPAKDFLGGSKKEFWEEVAASPRALLHNRAKTRGTINQASNHPLDYFGYVTVHNGTLINDTDLFDHFQIQRPADVDSVAIPLVVSQGKDLEDGLRHLSVLGGGCTTALWRPAEPDRMALARLGPNDLYLWYELQGDGDILYWSSAYAAGAYLHAISKGSLRFQQVTRLQDERVILLTPEKVRTFSLKRRPFTHPSPAARLPLLPAHSPKVSSGTLSYSATQDGRGLRGSHTVTDLIPAGERAKAKYGAAAGVGDWITFRDRPGLKFRFKWEQLGDFGACVGLKTKPFPMFENMKPRWLNKVDIVAGLLAQTAAGGYTSERTPYGTWHFRLVTEGSSKVIYPEFKPIKRMKPYLHGLFGKNYDLPLARDGEAVHICDGHLPLESFTIIEQNSTPVTIHKFGWMCPVCGIAAESGKWDKAGYRCHFCGIQSFIPQRKV